MDPLAPGALGAADMFLSVKSAKSGVINGESQDDKHKNEIDVLSWSWGMQGKPSLGGGAASGKATLRELRVTKRVDKASTALMWALRRNEEIKEAKLTVRKAGKAALEYLTIKIENGRVMSIDIDAGETSNSLTLLERVAFSFSKISVEYTPQAADGSAQGTSKFDDEWTPAS